MTLLDMQRVFSRLLTDKPFQQSFINGAVPPPAMYELTERELDGLRGLRWDRVGLHAELLAHGRLELALKVLPLTSVLLHDQLHGQIDRFCAEYPPVPQAASAVLVEATRLCAFAGGLIAEGTLRPAWAWDLLHYEQTRLELSLGSESAASAIRVAELNAGQDWPPADPDALVPVTGPHTKVARFSYPLPDLIPVLQNGVPDGGLPGEVRPLGRPLLLLFCKSPRGPVQVARVNDATAALIKACDGDRTLAGVAEHFTHTADAASQPLAQERVLAAIGQLRDGGVVGLRKRF